MSKNANFYHIQQCKPFIIQSIDSIISVYKQKQRFNPSKQRTKYTQLIQWMIQRFSNLKQLSQKQQQMSITQIMDEQKKIVISSYIQMSQLLSNECQQKGIILKIIMQYTLQTINTLVKSLQKSTNKQLFQMIKSNQKIEEENYSRIKELQAENSQYKKQKQHRWKNMFMVVKDNRVVKKQKMKLIKKIRQEHWNVKILNEEILNLKNQNQKYKLLLSSEQNPTKLNSYLNSKLKLTLMQKKIAEYPKHAKRILMKQLETIQINQFNTLDQKIEYIIKVIDFTGEVVDAQDDYDQVATNQKMYYNAFAQTQILVSQFATNTIAIKTNEKFTQIPISNLSQNFKIQSRVVDEKEFYYKIQRCKIKGKTMIVIDYEIGKILQNKRQKNSISNLQVSLSFDPEQIKYKNYADSPAKTNNFMISSTKRNVKHRLQTSANRLLEEEQQQQDKQNQQINNKAHIPQQRLKFKQEFQNKQDSQEVNRGPFKRASSLANIHMMSSKKKLRDIASKNISREWRIKKTFDITIDKIQCDTNQQFNVHINHLDKIQQSSRNSSFHSSENDLNQQQLHQSKKIKKRNSIKNTHPTHLTELEKIKNHFKKLPAKNSKQKLKIKLQKSNDIQMQEDTNYIKNSNEQVIQSQSSIDQISQQQNKTKNNKRNISYNLNKISKKDLFLKKKQYRQSENSQTLNLFQSKFLKSKPKQSRITSFSNSLMAPYKGYPGGIEKRQSKNSLLLSEKSNESQFKKQHFRTRTHGFQQILQLSQQLQNKMSPTQKQIQRKNSVKTSQSAINKLKPIRRMATQIVNKVQLFQKIQKVKTKEKLSHTNQIDLLKSIQKVIKNISQRSIQIFKNKYTFKQFLVTYYQQNYGDYLRSTQQFLAQMGNRKYYNQPIVQALSILMNTQANQKYLQDIFKIFATIIERNGGMLSKNLGELHNKQVSRFVLGWFFDQQKIDQIIRDLCIEVLNGSILDYFIAIQAQIRKNTLNSKVYKFLKSFVLPSESTISYQLLKQISFCLKNQHLQQNHNSKSKMLLNLKVLTEQNIQLHRLTLIIDKIKWPQFLVLPEYIQQKYLKIFAIFSQQEVINDCSKSKSFILNFPLLKQIFDKKVQNYYTHNIEIGRQFLMLCKLILVEAKIEASLQNHFPNFLRILNQKYDFVDSKQFYEKLISQN